MIDNMQGLYPSALDAYEAGKRNGQNEALRVALTSLSHISSKHESVGDAQGFLAAEECCKAVVEIKDKLAKK